jgi:hypothetical protein
LLKQQSPITVSDLHTKEKNFRVPFLFAANKQKFAVFRLQKTNGSCLFPLVPFSFSGILETWKQGPRDMETWT